MKCTNMKCTTHIKFVFLGNKQSSICVFDLVTSSSATSHIQGCMVFDPGVLEASKWESLNCTQKSEIQCYILCFSLYKEQITEAKSQ